jgi:hypothetical protein
MTNTAEEWLLGALAGAAVTAVVLVLRRRAAASPSSTMRALAGEAVRRAREEHGVGLDYAPESVERVEAILAAIQAAAPGDADVRRESLIWGAYVGEVLARNGSGRWARPAAGRSSCPVRWQGREAFPVAWCRERLTEGAAHDVGAKYREATGGPT